MWRKIALWLAGIGVVLAVTMVGLVQVLNSDAGKRWLEANIASLSGGVVRLAGLEGHVPDDLRVGRLELLDPQGVWLTVHDLRLAWTPWDLLSGEFLAERLEAASIRFERLPAPAEPQTESSGALPWALRLNSLRIAKLELGEAVAGTPAAISITGHGGWRGGVLNGELDIDRLGGAGRYRLKVETSADRLIAHIELSEPPEGLLAALLGLPKIGALDLKAELSGPLNAVRTQADLSAGPLRGELHGQVDLQAESGQLQLRVDAPAMQPAPGISWSAVALTADIAGTLQQPTIDAKLHAEAIHAGGVELPRLQAEIKGTGGNLTVTATAEGLRLPGPTPDLLAGRPLRLQAALRLDQSRIPLTWQLHHPLLQVKGSGELAEPMRAAIELHLPELKPLDGIIGAPLAGRSQFKLDLQSEAKAQRLTWSGAVNLTAAPAPLLAMLGPEAQLTGNGVLNGGRFELKSFAVSGKNLNARASGDMGADQNQLEWHASLTDLSAVNAKLQGALDGAGRFQTQAGGWTVSANLAGQLAAPGFAKSPLNATADLQGSANGASGTVTAQTVLAGSPVNLAAQLLRDAGGAVQVRVDHGDWRSTRLTGTVDLDPAGQPLAKLDWHTGNLADLRPWVAVPLGGAVSGRAEFSGGGLAVNLDGTRLTIANQAINQARARINLKPPFEQPALDAELRLNGSDAPGLADVAATLTVSGRLDALAFTLAAEAKPNGKPAKLDAAGHANLAAQTAGLSRLQLDWGKHPLRLADPVELAFGSGVELGKLRVERGRASLEAGGKLLPQLDADLEFRSPAAELAEFFGPAWPADGDMRVSASLSGDLDHPRGPVELDFRGLRIQRGSARFLPLAQLVGKAELSGDSAAIDLRMDAGASLKLALSGTAPLRTDNPLALNLQGSSDLAMLNPWLEGDGRRVQGRMRVDARLLGNLISPEIEGRAELRGGDIQDDASGLHIEAISADLHASRDELRLQRGEAKAGGGALGFTGWLRPGQPGVPLELRLTARDAAPLSQDRVIARLDADLAVRGGLRETLTASGKIGLRSAEIQIPERLPTKIVELEIRRAGAKPSSEKSTAVALNLDLLFDAPGQIVIRGRGLDAELSGRVKVRGTTAEPRPDGHFELRRGRFDIAGQSLNLTRGRVGFDGGSFSDPSLDFAAEAASASVTAILTLQGSVAKPVIQLSSNPVVPRDEILSQLLFQRGSSSLSPFEWARLATALASLSGLDLEGDVMNTMRQGLGLDRLAIGSDRRGGPTLEAGRYVAPGVYVGAKQGFNSSGTAATVQVDVARGLKVEGSLGTGGSANGSNSGSSSANGSVGVIYQFEY